MKRKGSAVESSFDFINPVSRIGTGSLKWERYGGRDVLPLWVADMDFRSAPEILEALRRRVEHGVFGYTVPYAEVEEVVCDYLKQRHGLAADHRSLHWVPGLVPALNVVCRAFGAPGDAVMTCTPVYPPFLSAPRNNGRELITVPLRRDHACWRFDFESMEAAVTPKTRVFILCNPHNPVGRVFEKEELDELVAFCDRHDLVLCSDEIHCDLILEPERRHVPALALSDEAARRTVALYAPSKTYNLPGLACAYAVIPEPRLRAAFKRAAQGFITEVNCFGYAGCAAAYRDGEPWRRELLRVLRGNRDLVYSFVAERIPSVRIHPMEATYLAWLDFGELGFESPAAYLERHGLGLSEGASFGESGAGWARLNFGCPRSVLESGLERLEKAVAAL